MVADIEPNKKKGPAGGNSLTRKSGAQMLPQGKNQASKKALVAKKGEVHGND
jgi:hypothetical protein